MPPATYYNLSSQSQLTTDRQWSWLLKCCHRFMDEHPDKACGEVVVYKRTHDPYGRRRRVVLVADVCWSNPNTITGQLTIEMVGYKA